MARIQSITFRQYSRVILLRQDYLEICNGEHCPAFVLAQHQYWHEVKIGSVMQAIEHNQAAAAGNQPPAQDTELWVYKSQPQMQDELMDLYGERKIADAYGLLQTKGFLRSRNNPLYRWDRKKQWLFMTINVQTAINQLPPILAPILDTQEAESIPAEMRTSIPQKRGMDHANDLPRRRSNAGSKPQMGGSISIDLITDQIVRSHTRNSACVGKFTFSQYCEYVNECIRRKQTVDNPVGLASWLEETGKRDDEVERVLNEIAERDAAAPAPRLGRPAPGCPTCGGVIDRSRPPCPCRQRDYDGALGDDATPLWLRALLGFPATRRADIFKDSDLTEADQEMLTTLVEQTPMETVEDN